MRPFRVTFWLASPVCVNHPWLHLDGLTAHLKYEERMGRAYRHLPSKAVMSQEGRDRPLFQKTAGVRHASVSIFCPDVPFTTQAYFKRFEPAGFPESGQRKVNIGSGHYRNYMLRSVLVPCERVEFHGCGDAGRVAELLSTVTHLGNDGRVGHGRILRLEVSEEDEDLSIITHGIAMRPIPVTALRRWSEAVPLAWHAPYWAPGSVGLCAPPGAEVELA